MAMSTRLDSSPSVFSSLTPSLLTANEEIFTLINHRESTAVIFDFEKRHLNARAIIRVIDFRSRKVGETRSRTLRFKIKSTFASRPYENEAITFTGGGFTASAVTKDNTTRIISASPDFLLPDGERGLKTLLSFSLDPAGASFNRLYTKSRYYEAVHTSLSPCVSGSIRKGGIKKEIEDADYSAYYLWKLSSFPLKRSSNTLFCYGRTDSPFLFRLSLRDGKCIFLKNNSLESFEGIRASEEKGEYIFSNSGSVSITFTPFHTEMEKTGPFRENRILRYGVFTGRIGDYSLPPSFGCMEK